MLQLSFRQRSFDVVCCFEIGFGRLCTDIGQDGELDGISLRIRYKDYRGRDRRSS